jgi:hypothetical protein
MGPLFFAANPLSTSQHSHHTLALTGLRYQETTSITTNATTTAIGGKIAVKQPFAARPNEIIDDDNQNHLLVRKSS